MVESILLLRTHAVGAAAQSIVLQGAATLRTHFVGVATQFIYKTPGWRRLESVMDDTP